MFYRKQIAVMETIAVISIGLSITAAITALILAAISDIKRYIIPNWIVVAILLSYIISAIFMPIGYIFSGFIVGIVVFSVGSVLFSLGLMGGGDVKLLAAVSLWAGVAHVVAFMLVTSLCGAALGVIMLSPLRRLMPPPSEGALRLTGANRTPMPFGAAIAFGGVFVLALQLHLPL